MSDDDVVSIKADLHLMEGMLALTLVLQITTPASMLGLWVKFGDIIGQLTQISARLNT
jgi:hypothetical protein